MVKIFKYSVYLSLFSVLFCSCAAKKDIILMRQEISEQNKITESRLVSIETTVTSVDSLLRQQYAIVKRVQALGGTQSQEQKDNLALITARLDDIYYQINELQKKLQAIQLYGGMEIQPSPSDSSKSTPNSIQPDASGAKAPGLMQKVNPKELYDSALTDLNNGQFFLAESRFMSFLLQFPDHELSGNAQYWLGESAYGQQKYDVAVQEFKRVIDNYPKSQKVPAAMLKLGFSQLQLGDKKSGVTVLRKLIKMFPKSEEADLARQRLK